MYYRFNKVNFDGTEVGPEFIVEGTGEAFVEQGIEQVTTLDHRIRRVLVAEKGTAKMMLYGDWGTLATQARVADNDNFGGTHKFYSGATLLLTFEGLVDAEYNPETRMTRVEIKGEYDGVS